MAAKVDASLHHVFFDACKMMAQSSMVAVYFDEKKHIDDIAQFCLQIQSWCHGGMPKEVKYLMCSEDPAIPV